MSLDVSLVKNGAEVYAANITHNLTGMAKECGLYYALWRPEERGMRHACNLTADIREGLSRLVTNKAEMEKFNPENGWGDWQALVTFAADYLDACRNYPDAEVEVSR